MNKKDQLVFVGLSGGVDSSVAALRLKQQGYDVVGVFIKVWHPDFLECNWEQERLDAMRIAAHLDIPFLTCDAEEAYRTEVGEFFVNEYKAGRTPNPDVMCNQHVKFGAFLDFAQQHGADYVATGHYAQNKPTASNFELHRGIDTNKDQSYFLWTLTQEQLQYVLLPVGDSPKTKIREEAEAAAIPVAAKKDSQGICFLGQVDIAEFMSHFVDLVPGPVLDELGTVIGTHTGALVYTLGQRHGFTISTTDTARGAYFVIDKDSTKNTLTVSQTPPKVASKTVYTMSNINWITAEPEVGSILEAQFRYRQTPFLITYQGEGRIVLNNETEAVANGQSCVLYQGGLCLGGGIIG